MQPHDHVANILSWCAVALLTLSYWFQIWKIHKHKEVRDLSMTYHIFLALGFAILTYTAWREDSTIFLVKQIATTIPVVIIIVQILTHKGKLWHDDVDPYCKNCKQELELNWNFCSNCGTEKNNGHIHLQAEIDSELEELSYEPFDGLYFEHLTRPRSDTTFLEQ